MPFFRDLRESRRRSKAALAAKNSPTKSVNGTAALAAESSSTLGSVNDDSTPLSSFPPTSPSKPLTPSESRPGRISPAKRLSSSGLSILSINGGARSRPQSQQVISPYGPCLVSISDNSWVHQKVLLVYGQIGDATQPGFDGTLTVYHHQDSFPPTVWPVCDSHFKALVHLTPGPNRLRLDFISPKLSSTNFPNPAHITWYSINYLPLVTSPPLQLAILVAKDSPLTFDAVPERIQREGNGLDTATRKFRMAAYLWQAFTGEQMYRNQFGRRCFRFEEEWQTGTLTRRDLETGQMRNEAKVHIVRTEKSVQEIRDLDVAQQYQHASRKGDLFTIALDAVRNHFKPVPGQKQYVSGLVLDSHWDRQVGVIRGHAALGGGVGEIQLAIFGSHALQSYPSCIEEVVPAFSDCTRTDLNFIANDCNESGSSWEAANIGIGSHLHETGHLFGCPHQESGVMLRDYVRLNRTFTCREPYSTRTKSPGLRLCLPKDECNWHRLDCLRFRFHPCFRTPYDPPLTSDDSVQVWPVGNGNALVTAVTGIAFIELFAEEELCRSHLEFVEGNALGHLPRQVMLNEVELRNKLPEDRRARRLRLEIHSAGLGRKAVDDFSKLTSKSLCLKLPNGQLGFKGGRVGLSRMAGSKPQDLVLDSAMLPTKLLTHIKIYHGLAVDGLEFFYEDFTSQLFGKRGGKVGGSDFSLDIRRGETVLGYYLRAGHWIDGLEIITTLGRRSGVFGSALVGSGHTLIPPRGYRIAGLSGSCGPWLDGFSLIISR